MMKKLSVLVGGIAVVNDCSFYSRNIQHYCVRPNFPVPKIPLACYSAHETNENHELGQRKNASSSFIERRKGRRVAVSLTDMVEEAGKARAIALPAEKRRSISKVHVEEYRAEKKLPVKPQSIDARSQVYAEDELVPDINPRWYVLKVKVGKERNVCDTIQQNIEPWDLRETILKVVVPSRRVTRTIRKKLIAQDVPLHPGYVYMKCLMSERLRELVTHLPPVAGFMGERKDKRQVTIPMSANEAQIQHLLSDVEAGKFFIDSFDKIHGKDLEIGDMVKITKGSYSGQMGLLDIVRAEEVIVKLFINGQSSHVSLGHRDIRKVCLCIMSHGSNQHLIIPCKLSDAERRAEEDSISLVQEGWYADQSQGMQPDERGRGTLGV